jgi:hypothetical protein
MLLIIIFFKVLFEVNLPNLQPIPLSLNLTQLDLEIFRCDNFKQWEKYFTEIENWHFELNREKVPPIT